MVNIYICFGYINEGYPKQANNDQFTSKNYPRQQITPVEQNIHRVSNNFNNNNNNSYNGGVNRLGGSSFINELDTPMPVIPAPHYQ